MGRLISAVVIGFILAGCKGPERIVYVPQPVEVPIFVKDTTFYPVMRDFVTRDSLHVMEMDQIDPDSASTAEKVAAVKADLFWLDGFINEIMAYFQFWTKGQE